MTPEEARKLRVLCEMAWDLIGTHRAEPPLRIAVGGLSLILEVVLDEVIGAMDAEEKNPSQAAFMKLHALLDQRFQEDPTDPYQDWLRGGDE